MFSTPVWLATRSAFPALDRRLGLYGYHDLFGVDKSLGGTAFGASQCSFSLSFLDILVVASFGVLVYPQLCQS